MDNDVIVFDWVAVEVCGVCDCGNGNNSRGGDGVIALGL